MDLIILHGENMREAKKEFGLTLSYKDGLSGVSIENGWFQIRSVLYVPDTSVAIQVDLYANEEAYVQEMSPVFHNLRGNIVCDTQDC